MHTADRPPRLPQPCGDMSAGIIAALRGDAGTGVPAPADGDPWDRDAQLSLHTCYGLHYRGFEDVDPEWEWDPGLLGLRAVLERRFLEWLRAETAGGADLDAELDQLLTVPEEDSGLSAFLRDQGLPWQAREYFVHRSILHHQEADPYAWLIPRLRGEAKAALVAVEFDEFGGGHGERIHQRLYADLLRGAGLNPTYLRYLDVVPTQMLAIVTMMSLFGLHRTLRGAGVGHFAAVEISSSPASKRMVDALERLEADPACVRFYREHVEADAVHEQLMRRGVIDDLLAQEPDLRESMVFGMQATTLLEDRFTEFVLGQWQAGSSSLLADVPEVGADGETLRSGTG
ncbi:iron-containing redox enzyme family protein [Nocardia sp. 2]|uniref:Iron-containing redox enzyme family protein n=2 Tax=Nocardia acididurans TaxID=2802282 RepID=A0ABS1M8A2_9NOCA|nr:iron-containing redox enzyme family protein [Nocardia acididurans]